MTSAPLSSLLSLYFPSPTSLSLLWIVSMGLLLTITQTDSESKARLTWFLLDNAASFGTKGFVEFQIIQQLTLFCLARIGGGEKRERKRLRIGLARAKRHLWRVLLDRSGRLDHWTLVTFAPELIIVTLLNSPWLCEGYLLWFLVSEKITGHNQTHYWTNCQVCSCYSSLKGSVTLKKTSQ